MRHTLQNDDRGGLRRLLFEIAPKNTVVFIRHEAVCVWQCSTSVQCEIGDGVKSHSVPNFTFSVAGACPVEVVRVLMCYLPGILFWQGTFTWHLPHP